MKSVSIVVYCDSDILSLSQRVLFECHSGPKIVTISEDISYDALRKKIMNVIGGCKILLDYFYRQLVYIGDGCVEYECMKLKRNDDEKKMFSSFWNLIVKV